MRRHRLRKKLGDARLPEAEQQYPKLSAVTARFMNVPYQQRKLNIN